MAKTTSSKSETKDNRPSAFAVRAAWTRYEIACNTGTSTAECRRLYLDAMTLQAERSGS